MLRPAPASRSGIPLRANPHRVAFLPHRCACRRAPVPRRSSALRRPDDPCFGEAGLLTTEFVLLYGLVLALVMSVVHFGLLYNAALAVSDAADVALEEVQAKGGSALRAQQLAKKVVGSEQMVRDLRVDIRSGGGQVSVSVSASSPRILPGLPTSVSRIAHGPIERFIPEGRR